MEVLGIIGGLVTVTAALYAIWSQLERIRNVLGTDRDGRDLPERLDRIEHQLYPNGGASLPDRLQRLEMGYVAHDAKLDTVLAILQKLPDTP